MGDYNNLTPEEEARRRAEKINAIKNSVRSAESGGIAENPQRQPKPVRQPANNQAKKKGSQNRKSSSSGKKKPVKKKKSLATKFRELFPEKQDSILEKIRKIVFLCSIVAIVVCGYLVGDYYLDLWKNKRLNNSLVEIHNIYDDSGDDTNQTGEESEKYYRIMDGAKKLLDINSDTVGWIRIPDTPVDYPVVKASNNDKYLDMSFNGAENRAGSIFMDYRCHFDEVWDHHLVTENSDNIVIYGHNMMDASMFGSLNYYHSYSEDYYSQHPIVELNSNYEKYKYKIFAFFIVDAQDESDTKYDCWNNFDFGDEQEFYDFVNEAKKRTMRLNDVDVQYGDKILTLSTCNTLLGERSRFIVMARLVRNGEDLYSGTQTSKANTNIKWPNMYYQSHSYERYDPNAPFVPYGPAKTEETPENIAEQPEGEN